jgi:site-specific DNA recombinase
VTVNDEQVQIRGSRKALERAVIATVGTGRTKVPSFAREWRARKDSNLRPPDS